MKCTLSDCDCFLHDCWFVTHFIHCSGDNSISIFIGKFSHFFVFFYMHVFML